MRDAEVGIERRVRLAGWTHPGRRRTDNQDRYFVGQGLLVVADGMGGHAGGGDAASTVVDTLALIEQPTDADFGDSALEYRVGVDAIERAHRAVQAEASMTGRESMGATVTAIMIDPQLHVAVLSAGDSPAYVWDGSSLTCVTVDHTAEVVVVDPDGQRRVRSGLTRCVGGNRERVDPDVVTLSLGPGCAIFAVSDGITKELNDQEIASIVASCSGPEMLCERLGNAALERGGRDNVTVVAAFVAVPMVRDAT